MNYKLAFGEGGREGEPWAHVMPALDILKKLGIQELEKSYLQLIMGRSINSPWSLLPAALHLGHCLLSLSCRFAGRRF